MNRTHRLVIQLNDLEYERTERVAKYYELDIPSLFRHVLKVAHDDKIVCTVGVGELQCRKPMARIWVLDEDFTVGASTARAGKEYPICAEHADTEIMRKGHWKQLSADEQTAIDRIQP